jgi:hypothetical protein
MSAKSKRKIRNNALINASMVFDLFFYRLFLIIVATFYVLSPKVFLKETPINHY